MGAVPAVRPAIEVDTVFAVATALTVGHRQGYGLATTLASTQKRDNSNVAADLLFLGEVFTFGRGLGKCGPAGGLATG